MAVEPSFPSLHVTGPVHVFARTPGHSWYSPAEANKIWYVGTCVTQPQVKHQKMRLDVFNDIGGRKVPFQQLEQGEVGLIGLMMNRFSHTAYDAIRKAGGIDGNTLTPGAGMGYESLYARGAFSMGRVSVELWLLYQFGFGADIPGQAGPSTTPGLPRGRYYPTAMLANHDIADSGTADEKLLLVFNALPLYLSTSFAVGDPRRRGFALYSESESDFPTEIINANAQ